MVSDGVGQWPGQTGLSNLCRHLRFVPMSMASKVSGQLWQLQETEEVLQGPWGFAVAMRKLFGEYEQC